MKYLYTATMCPACEKRKRELKRQGIDYVERKGTRLKTPEADFDDIDKDALVQLAINNDTLPVEVDA